MAEVTVLQLAERLSIPLDRLLQQMKDADLPHEGPGDAINDDQQARLLTHLRGVHGEEKPKSKITLKRRESSTLRAGRSTVNVQVRKKRTIVRRPVEEPEPEPVPEPVVEKPPIEEPVAEAKTLETEPATPELEVVAEETPGPRSPSDRDRGGARNLGVRRPAVFPGRVHVRRRAAA